MVRQLTIALYLLAACSAAVADPPQKPDPASHLEAVTHHATVTYYDPDPNHLWNRLHVCLLTRPGRDGKMLGRDALDPHLFPTTKRLLTGPTHAEAVKLLDEFLAGGHALVRDPLKRAVLQRDLWAVFDWAVYPFGNFYTSGDPIEIREGPLQERLAKAVRRLAPSQAEAAQLPDNYALALREKSFPPVFDPGEPNGPFLPPDLLDPDGPWVCVTGPREMPTPIASEHARVFAGRSVFLVFLKLPEGRKATLAYLDQLNTFPHPWRVPPEKTDETGRRAALELSPDLPQFPVGTQVALVRQLMVVTDDGQPAATSLTESVQFRTYREILSREREFAGPAETAQGFAEFELRRADLFAAKNGGLRAIKADELVPSALTFFRSWIDPNEAREKDTHNRPEQALRLCAACHSRGGIYGVNSYTQFSVARPTAALGMFPVSLADARSRAAEWLTGLKDWTELKNLAGW